MTINSAFTYASGTPSLNEPGVITSFVLMIVASAVCLIRSLMAFVRYKTLPFSVDFLQTVSLLLQIVLQMVYFARECNYSATPMLVFIMLRFLASFVVQWNKLDNNIERQPLTAFALLGTLVGGLFSGIFYISKVQKGTLGDCEFFNRFVKYWTIAMAIAQGIMVLVYVTNIGVYCQRQELNKSPKTHKIVSFYTVFYKAYGLLSVIALLSISLNTIAMWMDPLWDSKRIIFHLLCIVEVWAHQYDYEGALQSKKHHSRGTPIEQLRKGGNEPLTPQASRIEHGIGSTPLGDAPEILTPSSISGRPSSQTSDAPLAN